jgi:hypothetical protein
MKKLFFILYSLSFMHPAFALPGCPDHYQTITKIYGGTRITDVPFIWSRGFPELPDCPSGNCAYYWNDTDMNTGFCYQGIGNTEFKCITNGGTWHPPYPSCCNGDNDPFCRAEKTSCICDTGFFSTFPTSGGNCFCNNPSIVCAAGTYKTESGECFVCPDDTYKNNTSPSTSCVKCPHDYLYIDSSSPQDHDNVNDCKFKELCPAGEYGYIVAARGENTCKKCPLAETSRNGDKIYGTTDPSTPITDTNNTYTINKCIVKTRDNHKFYDDAGTYIISRDCAATNGKTTYAPPLKPGVSF